MLTVSISASHSQNMSKKLTLQIILGNVSRNARTFKTFVSGIFFVCPTFSLNHILLARLLNIGILLKARSDSTLVNLFRRSISSLLMFVNLKPYLLAFICQVSLVIASSESFLSCKKIYVTLTGISTKSLTTKTALYTSYHYTTHYTLLLGINSALYS